MAKYDFQGWATKNNLKCEDGVVIRPGAFKVKDGTVLPLVYNHGHDDIGDILGHAVLYNKPEGIYVYGSFNDTPAGQHAKESVKHGDVKSLSVYANNIVKNGTDVVHGVLREISLCLAGCNPGAFIESVMAHGIAMGEDDDEAILYTGDELILESTISHAAPDDEKGKKEDKTVNDDDKKKEGSSGKTVGDIFNTLNEDQKKAVAVIVGQAIEDAKSGKNDDDEGGDDEMKHNAFANKTEEQGGGYAVLSHSDVERIFKNAKKIGSLRDSIHEFCDEMGYEDGILAHSIDTAGMTVSTGKSTYGFNDPEMLFPEYKTLNNPPEWISRNMDWVQVVMSGVSRTPFSRIKSVYADITADEARARGYMKGGLKKEEVFTILKRTTDPQTIYKKQKLDRDDVIDIVDFDVVAWIRAEMRVMLNEEIARAILIGDGRPADSEDKIKEANIRPIVTDVPLFNITVKIAEKADENFYDTMEDEIIRSRKEYKGSGNPTFFTTEDVLTELLLRRDKIGHKLYKTEAELATALRVSRIVTVEPMEGMQIKVENKPMDLLGVIVNLRDYNVGADKGGEINNFEDFDIDYNQMKYLIETRISGALVRPFSAITLVKASGTSAASFKA